MYFLIKWFIGWLKRRSAAASPERAAGPAPDQPMVRSPGGQLVSQDRTVAPSAGHDGAALSVRNLSKRFGNRIAFQDVSFEVGYGEVFGFLGPNGAGKTTTVRTLATLIKPTSGSATVAGIPLAPENGVEIRRRRSPPTPWSASASRARWSRCSARRSAARSSCWARPALLLVLNGIGWRVTSAMFDRERLITGTR